MEREGKEDATRGARGAEPSPRSDLSEAVDSTEGPLRALVLVAAALLWAALIASVVGILVMLVRILVRWGRALVRVARIRGDAVKVGPNQFPEVDDRIRELCDRLGVEPRPSVYVVRELDGTDVEALQVFGERLLVCSAGFATRALGHRTGHPDSCDFFIAHELAAFRADHLRWRAFLEPGLWVPCLGAAYARACVHTRDRLAAAALGLRPESLARLFAARAYGRESSLVPESSIVPDWEPFSAQHRDLASLWATLGEWLSATPSLVRRLQVLESESLPAPVPRRSRATAWVASLVLVSTLGGAFLVFAALGVRLMARGTGMRFPESFALGTEAAWDATARVESALVSLAAAAEAYRSEQGVPPPSGEVLYQVWEVQHPGAPVPVDPYDSQRYGYTVEGDRYIIWSSGPDLETDEDDISYLSPETPGGLGEVTTGFGAAAGLGDGTPAGDP